MDMSQEKYHVRDCLGRTFIQISGALENDGCSKGCTGGCDDKFLRFFGLAGLEDDFAGDLSNYVSI